MSVRHFLTLTDFTSEEILRLVELSAKFKSKRKMGNRVDHILKDKSIALIFQKPSTRTRASLSVAIKELGGFPVTFNWNELQLGRGESIADTARVLSRYFDAIIARVYSHNDLLEMARYSSVPVLNALSDMFHPMQAISDLFTIKEKLGRIKGIKLAFIGDGTSNVLNSLLIAGSKVGMHIVIACPKEYSPRSNVLSLARSFAQNSGAIIEITEDPVKAVRTADIIYTDVFVSMGFEAEREKRLKVFYPKYSVTKALLEKCEKKDYIFMHCLPAHRGEEVEDEVMDDIKHSVVFDQAENRLHSSKAILTYVLGDRVWD